MCLLWLTIFILRLSQIVSLSNGLGLTPAMGFSTWNRFYTNIDEKTVREIAQALVDLGLKDAGYVYMNIDAGWADNMRDKDGNLQANTAIFPSGMFSLGEHIHSKGLRFGLYTDLGVGGCGSGPGSGGYYAQDAQLFASWEIDFLKIDDCDSNHSIKQGGAEELTAWTEFAQALNKTNRPIYVSACPQSLISVNVNSSFPWALPWAGKMVYVPPLNWSQTDKFAFANSWLVEVENNVDEWWAISDSAHCLEAAPAGLPCGMITNIDSILSFGKLEETGPGGLVDSDMLEVCQFNGTLNKDGLTAAENRLHFYTWAIMPSPLILAFDPRSINKTQEGQECLEMVKNKEIIAINQDPLVKGARLLRQGGNVSDSRSITFQVLSRPLAPIAGSQSVRFAAVLLNRGSETLNVTLSWQEMGLPHPELSASVRNVGIQQDLGKFLDNFSATISPHDAVMVTVVQDQ